MNGEDELERSGGAYFQTGSSPFLLTMFDLGYFPSSQNSSWISYSLSKYRLCHFLSLRPPSLTAAHL